MTDTEQGDVEKVARMVNPTAWICELEDLAECWHAGVLEARADAFAKAREIIAALKASPRSALEPGDLERLAGIRRKLVFHHCEGLAHDIACLARFEALAGTVEE